MSSELLRNGWAKLKEIKREPNEEDLKKRELESEAKAAGRGVWNPHGQAVNSLIQLVCVDLVHRRIFIGPGGPSHYAARLSGIRGGVEG